MEEIISQLPRSVILKALGKKAVLGSFLCTGSLATISRVSSSLGNLNINYYISILQRFSTLKKYFITAANCRAQLNASCNCFLHLLISLLYRLLSLIYCHLGYTSMLSNNLQVFKIVATPVFAEGYKIVKTGLKMMGEAEQMLCFREASEHCISGLSD